VRKSVKMDTDGLIVSVLLSICLVLVFLCAVFAVNERSEIAQSICEKEYGMDFDSYEEGTLYCKPAPVTESYDGIKVVIGGKE